MPVSSQNAQSGVEQKTLHLSRITANAEVPTSTPKLAINDVHRVRQHSLSGFFRYNKRQHQSTSRTPDTGVEGNTLLWAYRWRMTNVKRQQKAAYEQRRRRRWGLVKKVRDYGAEFNTEAYLLLKEADQTFCASSGVDWTPTSNDIVGGEHNRAQACHAYFIQSKAVRIVQPKGRHNQRVANQTVRAVLRIDTNNITAEYTGMLHAQYTTQKIRWVTGRDKCPILIAFPKTSEGFVWGPEVLEAKLETSPETLSLFLPFTLPAECWSTWEPVLDSKIRSMDLLYVDKNNNEHTVTLEDIWQDFLREVLEYVMEYVQRRHPRKPVDMAIYVGNQVSAHHRERILGQCKAASFSEITIIQQ